MTTSIKLYRIECPEGCGPYCCYHLWNANTMDVLSSMISDHDCSYSDEHPEPTDEGIEFIEGKSRSAFQNAHQMVAWFGDYYPVLLKIGFVVRTYVIPEDRVSFGYYQVAFIP